MIDASFNNMAPDQDTIVVEIGNKAWRHPLVPQWRITVERNEQGQVFIAVRDLADHTETRMVLGQEGHTTLDV